MPTTVLQAPPRIVRPCDGPHNLDIVFLTHKNSPTKRIAELQKSKYFLSVKLLSPK